MRLFRHASIPATRSFPPPQKLPVFSLSVEVASQGEVEDTPFRHQSNSPRARINFERKSSRAPHSPPIPTSLWLRLPLFLISISSTARDASLRPYSLRTSKFDTQAGLSVSTRHRSLFYARFYSRRQIRFSVVGEIVPLSASSAPCQRSQTP